jgi:hypothetical protein
MKVCLILQLLKNAVRGSRRLLAPLLTPFFVRGV